jgi:response regulator RpfG family c-di-GMP phosphodiesterase
MAGVAGGIGIAQRGTGAGMNQRVLFVDDEPQVLEGIQRALRKRVELQTAATGAEGLRLISEEGPFALVISDMRMPGMNGAQFLAKVREQAPDIVRMILSGQSDMQATIDAVNEGYIYRFLSKPCAAEQLFLAIEDGLKQHRLITAEKELLEHTLSGCVKMLIEILGMVSPAASSRASRIQRYTLALADSLHLPNRWEWSLAALVSQIGCVALPAELLSKVESGETLSEEERKLHESHPEVAGKLLVAIPRLEDVAYIVSAQFGVLNFADQPAELSLWDVRSIGRLLLRSAADFDRMVMGSIRRDAAAETLRLSKMAVPACVIEALHKLAPVSQERVIKQLRLKDLAPGMILDEDLVSSKGIRLVPAGNQVTRSLIVRLNSIATGVGVAEPFRVAVPK